MFSPLCLLCFVLFLSQSLSFTNISLNQYEALSSLYDATNGPYWTWKLPYNETGYPWDFSGSNHSDPCDLNYPWQGIQCSTNCTSSSCNITHIQLTNYHLQGTIPSNISQLIGLFVLDLSTNQLIHTIPSQLCQLTQLSAINLNDNQLIGTIPTMIHQLIHLQYLEIAQNQLNGSIPMGLYNLTELHVLNVYDNQLTGSLSPYLQQLTQLHILGIDSNALTGSIPWEIGQLTQLMVFFLENNFLTGSIPSSLGHLTQLIYIEGDHNLLDGSLPNELNQLIALKYFEFDNNCLSGTLPSLATQLTSLMNVYLENNFLSGTLPTSWSNESSLIFLDLHTNLFTSTIPNTISQLSHLQYLILDINYLTGTIPTTIDQLTQLMDCNLNQNYLSQQIPSKLLTLSHLLIVNLAMNVLTGPLPSLLPVNMTNNTNNTPNNKLQYLILNHNFLTGTIPWIYNTMNQLEYVYLHENQLIGSLPDFSLSVKLRVLYVHNNSLTSTIPTQLFNKSELRAISLSLNCFSGTIPKTICQNTYLKQLTLDGLHSSSSCIHKLSPWPGSTSYYITNGVTGSLPSCLFELPLLVVFHASGNNLEGSLPQRLAHNTSLIMLTSLNLANNLLTGTIPKYLLLNHSISNLDLSFNLFSSFGINIQQIQLFQSNNFSSVLNITTNQNYTLNSSIRLNVNHLSGYTPPAYQSLDDINILRGNRFNCELFRQDLPPNDPYFNSYECGSEKTNDSLYTFVGLFVITLIFIRWKYGWKQLQRVYNLFESFGSNTLRMELHAWMLSKEKENEEHNSLALLSSIHYLNTMAIECEKLGKYLKWLVLWLMIGVTSCYIGLKFGYGTYEHQYIWIISSSNVSGFIPAFIMICIFQFTMFWLFFQIIFQIKSSQELSATNIFGNSIENYNNQKKSQEEIQSKNANSLNKVHNSWLQISKIFAFLLFNIILVIFLNIGYVSAVDMGYSFSTLMFISFLVSIFKLVWTNIMLLGIGRMWLRQYFNIYLTPEIVLGIMLFNNAIVPYIAEGFASSNCYLYVIQSPPMITTYYYDTNCQFRLVNLGILGFQIKPICSFEEIAYLPPFHYNYTCSSSLLLSFAYIFVFKYILSIFFIPIWCRWIKLFQRNYMSSYTQFQSFGCFKRLFPTPLTWFEFLSCFLPLLMIFEHGLIEQLIEIYPNSQESMVISNEETFQTNNKDLQTPSEETQSSEKLQDLSSSIDLSMKKSISEDINEKNTNDNSHKIALIITSIQVNLDLLLTCFDQLVPIGEVTITLLILDLTMLFSFGVLFPPLGLLIFLSLTKDIIIEQILLQRLLQASLNLSSLLQKNPEFCVPEIYGKILIIKQTIDVIINRINDQYQIWYDLWFKGLPYVIIIASFFWAFVLYDTLGYSEGAVDSLWVVIVMIGSPFLCFRGKVWYDWRKDYLKEQSRSISISVEMSPMSNISSIHV